MSAQLAPAPAAALRIARSSALLGGGVAVAQALSFGTGLLVTQQLGSEFGVFIGAQRFAGLFRTAADLGLAVLVVRAVASARPDAGAIFGTVLALRSVSTLGFAALVMGAALATGYLPQHLPILAAFAALNALDVLCETFSAALEGRERMGRAALVQIARAAALLAVVALAARAGAGLAAYSAAYVAASALQCACAAAFALRLSPPLRPALELGRTPALLRESTRYLGVATAYALLRALDVVLLTRFAGEAESARYGAALTLVEFGLMLPALVQRALLPAFSRSDGGAHEPVCADTLCLGFALFAPFAVGLVLLAPEAIALYGEADFDGAERALRPLSAMIPLGALATVAAAYLTGVGRVSDVLRVYAVAIPAHALCCAGAALAGASAGGMAWAALPGHALLAAGVLRAAARAGVALPWAAWARHGALCALMALAVGALRGRAPLPLTVLAGALAYGAGLYLASAAASPERRALDWLAAQIARREAPGT